MTEIQPPSEVGRGGSTAGWIGLVSIDDGSAVPMICHLLPDGDVVIPTGADFTVVEAAVDHTVRIEFDTCNGRCSPWTVSCLDCAVPVVAVEGHHWYLRADAPFDADSADNAVRVQILTSSSLPQTAA